MTSLTKPIRLWPGVVLAVLFVIIRFGLPLVNTEWLLVSGIGSMICALAILLWWLFFSRAPWIERIGVVAIGAALIYLALPVVHPSIAGGMMGMMLPAYATPIMLVGLVAAVAIARRSSTASRRAAIVFALAIACGSYALLRTDGILGGQADLHWRWTPTAEERLLAQAKDEPMTPLPAAPAALEPLQDAAAGKPAAAAAAVSTSPATPPTPAGPAEWPGFRGRDRDGVIRGVQIETDWAKSPPVQMWRRPIGPGWSSFAVAGDVLYTQEQRGADEVVGAYRVSTGAPVWRHRDPVRFWESNAGPGPRGTPTLSNGRVYSLGATGILNVLDARTGAVIWSRNVGDDTKTMVPMWGFTSSPLVEETDNLVIVAADAKLAAYDLATGAPRWFGPVHDSSYSSPHRVTVGGVRQILLLSADGATSVSPADGKLLWEHAWDSGGSTIIQPAVTADGDLLISAISAMGGLGIRRLSVTQGSGGWTVTERWTSNGLKPYFNDFVVHNGHAYGFDGSILSCIDLATGTRKWKGGRYGSGQLVLLPEQDVLVVISEEGGLALVSATPDQYRELAKAPAIEGKTWNHPVIVRDVLLVRNGEEMAALRLTVR